MELSTLLQETRRVLADGSILTITLDERNDHQLPLRDTRWSYALREGAGEAGRQDLLALLSLPLLPDMARSREARETHQGQQTLAANAPGGFERERYAGNAARAAWQAVHLLKFSREMPGAIGEVAPGVLVTAYRNDSVASRFQIVDIERGTVLRDFVGPDVDALFGGTGNFQRPAAESAELDELREQLGALGRFVPPSSGKNPSRVRLAAVAPQRLLFQLGPRGYALVAVDGAELKPVATLCQLPRFHWRVATFCRGYCVVYGREQHPSNDAIHVFSADDGRMIRRVVLRDGEILTSCSGSDTAGKVAFGAFGGAALVLDVESGEIERTRSNYGVDPNASPDVSLSPDGRWLVAAIGYAEQATLIDLHEHRYADLDAPSMQSHPLDDTVGASTLLRRPSIAALDGAVEYLRAGRRSRVDVASLSFRALRAPTPPMSVEAVRRDPLGALDGFGLGDRRETIAAWLRPAATLSATRLKTDSVPVGGSKFGGQPDLLVGTAWPQFEQRPMAFLAQIDLAALASAVGDTGLPRRGLLSFFRAVDARGGLLMYSHPQHDPRAALALYAPDSDELERFAPSRFSRNDAEPLPPCRMEFARRWLDLPPLDSLHLQSAQLSNEQRESYLELAGYLRIDDEQALRGHFAGGYPAVVENNDHERYAERLARGLDPYQYAKDEEDRAQREAAQRWVQLVQWDSCKQTGWDWGDGGRGQHWMIPAADLAAARFDRVVVMPS